jgi:hypothetical protein
MVLIAAAAAVIACDEESAEDWQYPQEASKREQLVLLIERYETAANEPDPEAASRILCEDVFRFETKPQPTANECVEAFAYRFEDAERRSQSPRGTFGSTDAASKLGNE